MAPPPLLVGHGHDAVRVRVRPRLRQHHVYTALLACRRATHNEPISPETAHGVALGHQQGPHLQVESHT